MPQIIQTFPAASIICVAEGMVVPLAEGEEELPEDEPPEDDEEELPEADPPEDDELELPEADPPEDDEEDPLEADPPEELPEAEPAARRGSPAILAHPGFHSYQLPLAASC